MPRHWTFQADTNVGLQETGTQTAWSAEAVHQIKSKKQEAESQTKLNKSLKKNQAEIIANDV